MTCHSGGSQQSYACMCVGSAGSANAGDHYMCNEGTYCNKDDTVDHGSSGPGLCTGGEGPAHITDVQWSDPTGVFNARLGFSMEILVTYSKAVDVTPGSQISLQALGHDSSGTFDTPLIVTTAGSAVTVVSFIGVVLPGDNLELWHQDELRLSVNGLSIEYPMLIKNAGSTTVNADHVISPAQTAGMTPVFKSIVRNCLPDMLSPAGGCVCEGYYSGEEYQCLANNMCVSGEQHQALACPVSCYGLDANDISDAHPCTCGTNAGNAPSGASIGNPPVCNTLLSSCAATPSGHGVCSR